MLGIGMRHQNGVDGGIAWRQNRDFEDLLRRLNGTETETGAMNASFHRARESEHESESKDDDGNEGQEGAVTGNEEKKKKKKKRKATEEEEEEELEGHDSDGKDRKKRRNKTSKDGHANGMPSGGIELESVPRSPREAPPARDESGSARVATVTAIATTVTAPVAVRAPYVACTFRGSENQRLMYSILHLLLHPHACSIPL